MSLSIRHWLAEHRIDLTQLGRVPISQIAGMAFHIAQNMEAKSLTPLDISVLAEVLELPLPVVWPEISMLAQLTSGLLRSLSQKKTLQRNEGTWLAFQIGYLHALQQVLEQEWLLKRPWLDRAMVATGSEAQDDRGILPLQEAQLQALLKTLRSGRLTDTQAEQALSMGAESFLVQQMNSANIAWLVANGAEEAEAKLLTQRLANGLPGHLLVVIAENALPLNQLQKFVRLGDLSSSVETQVASPVSPESDTSTAGTELLVIDDANSPSSQVKFDLHRERYRATLLQALSEPLLEECFALKDLYTPLTGVPIEEAGQGSAKPVDLMAWANAQLQDKSSIAVIEAEPGYGKTSFCQIWAAQIAQQVYPAWMPVLIQLRDMTHGKTLEESLNVFSIGDTSTNRWSSPHPPYLLLLDGLDELPHSRWGRTKATFIEQLLRFQAKNTRHKIFLTSRPLEEWVVERLISPFPTQFRRITMQPLAQEEFKHWFNQWSKVQSQAIALAYFNCLKAAGAFSRRAEVQGLATLVRQPLMLYLLGILHREGLLDDGIWRMVTARSKGEAGTALKLEIYDRLAKWLLEDPLTSDTAPLVPQAGLAHIHRTPEAIANLLQGRRPAECRHQMQTTALTIFQSDRRSTQTTSDSIGCLAGFYFKHLTASPSHLLTSSSRTLLKVEFSHPILGEYLCAEEIAAQLKLLTQTVPNGYGDVSFVLDSPSSVAQHLYNLLGYGVLTAEIENLLVERLRQQARQFETFSFQVLLERLYAFYLAYCRCRWLDEGVAHTARSHLQSRQNSLNTLQVDAAVGLNVFLLLCACHREVGVPFWPCGNPKTPEAFNPEALLTLIGRTAVLSPTAFVARTHFNTLTLLNLSGADLSQVMLAKVNLWRTNLSAANLIGANLAAANLQEANLSGANLSGANLTGANLSGANLTGANLTGTNLYHSQLKNTILTNACLFQALLDEANRATALLNGALFSASGATDETFTG